MERRETQRVEVALKCYLLTSPTTPGQELGRTENVSRSGVLVRLPADSSCVSMLTRGDHVELDLELPSRLPRHPPRSLHCLATVAWSRPAGGGEMHVALAVQQMKFRDLPRSLWPLAQARASREAVM